MKNRRRLSREDWRKGDVCRRRHQRKKEEVFSAARALFIPSRKERKKEREWEKGRKRERKKEERKRGGKSYQRLASTGTEGSFPHRKCTRSWNGKVSMANEKICEEGKNFFLSSSGLDQCVTFSLSSSWNPKSLIPKIASKHFFLRYFLFSLFGLGLSLSSVDLSFGAVSSSLARSLTRLACLLSSCLASHVERKRKKQKERKERENERKREEKRKKERRKRSLFLCCEHFLNPFFSFLLCVKEEEELNLVEKRKLFLQRRLCCITLAQQDRSVGWLVGWLARWNRALKSQI